MKEDYLTVGDVVGCVDWDGATGVELSELDCELFRVVETKKPRGADPKHYLASVVPLNAPLATIPITARWGRFVHHEHGMPDPDFSLDEIHVAQEIIGR